MKQSFIETIVGIFVVIGIVCIGYLTIKLGKMEVIGHKHYNVSASFQSISGLTPGAYVEIAGVKIGNVDSISLDPERKVAVVNMKIQKGVILSEDVIAAVKTSGLIGDKYIRLSPGGSDVTLKDGGKIFETESAIDIEDLVSKYIFSDE
ncbi:MAG: outer membrane lipid asymmetry maintenance protein MlaD [Desulfobacterales bacterium]|nr:outer membrane lipid asymmetry maintenance protein MlaD [Desulfobacterales bacterium]